MPLPTTTAPAPSPPRHAATSARATPRPRLRPTRRAPPRVAALQGINYTAFVNCATLTPAEQCPGYGAAQAYQEMQDSLSNQYDNAMATYDDSVAKLQQTVADAEARIDDMAPPAG